MNDLNYPIKVHELVENCLTVPYLKQVILSKLEQCIEMTNKLPSNLPYRSKIEAIYNTIQTCETDNASRVMAKTYICSNYAFLMTYTLQHEDNSFEVFTTIKRIIEC